MNWLYNMGQCPGGIVDVSEYKGDKYHMKWEVSEPNILKYDLCQA